jgi:superfamily II DNA or RNA helicase
LKKASRRKKLSLAFVALSQFKMAEGVLQWTEHITQSEDVLIATRDVLIVFLRQNLSVDDFQQFGVVSLRGRELRRLALSKSSQKDDLPKYTTFALSPLRSCEVHLLYRIVGELEYPLSRLELNGAAMQVLSVSLLPVKRGEALRRRLVVECLTTIERSFCAARFEDEARRFLEWTVLDAEAHTNADDLGDRIAWLSDTVRENFPCLANIVSDSIRFIKLHILPFLRDRPDLLFPSHCSFPQILGISSSLKWIALAREQEERRDGFFVRFGRVKLDELNLRDPQFQALQALQNLKLCPSEAPNKQEYESLLALRAWFGKALDLSYCECSSLSENTEVPIGKEDVFARMRSVKSSDGSDPPMIVVPTGVGKSHIMYLAPLVMAKLPGRVLVICPNLIIRGQIATGFSSFFNGLAATRRANGELVMDTTIAVKVIEQNGLNAAHDANFDVFVALPHAFQGSNLLERFPRGFFDLILVDEAHHAEARTYRLVREHFCSTPFVYVTATPFRGDEQIIRANKVFECSMISAIERKYVKNICWLPLPVKSISFEHRDGAEQTMDRKALEENCASFIDALKESRDSKLLVIGYAIRVLKKLRSISNLHHQAILQANSIEEADELKWLWQRHELHISDDQPFNRVEVVSSALSESENKEAIDALKNSELDAIVHVGMIGEGFDHAQLSVCCIFRRFGSFAPFAQFIGRAVRRNPNGTEEDNVAYIISHPGLGLYDHWKMLQEGCEQAPTREDFRLDTPNYDIQKIVGHDLGEDWEGFELFHET